METKLKITIFSRWIPLCFFLVFIVCFLAVTDSAVACMNGMIKEKVATMEIALFALGAIMWLLCLLSVVTNLSGVKRLLFSSVALGFSAIYIVQLLIFERRYNNGLFLPSPGIHILGIFIITVALFPKTKIFNRICGLLNPSIPPANSQ